MQVRGYSNGRVAVAREELPVTRILGKMTYLSGRVAGTARAYPSVQSMHIRVAATDS